MNDFAGSLAPQPGPPSRERSLPDHGRPSDRRYHHLPTPGQASQPRQLVLPVGEAKNITRYQTW